MNKRQKKTLLHRAAEFLRLQVAGNVLFLGTLSGTFIGTEIYGWDEFFSFLIASIVSNVAYFMLDRHWVFNEKGSRRKEARDIIRFIIFAIINFFLNLLIVKLFMTYGVNVYLSQVLSGFFFTVWSYVGLRFWVFAPSRHHAITYESPRRGRRYDHGPKRKTK